MRQIILASASVGRKGILERAHIPFIVEVSDYEEDMTLDLAPHDLAMELSKGKAEAVAPHHKDAIIIGADSFAVYQQHLLGKPHTKERAKEMLCMLNGNTHTFVTGYTIIDTQSGTRFSGYAKTQVKLKKISEEEIDGYLEKEDVLGKAASYSISGLGGSFIEKIDGDYNNVVGLPLSRVVEQLKNFGINILTD